MEVWEVYYNDEYGRLQMTRCHTEQECDSARMLVDVTGYELVAVYYINHLGVTKQIYDIMNGIYNKSEF